MSVCVCRSGLHIWRGAERRQPDPPRPGGPGDDPELRVPPHLLLLRHPRRQAHIHTLRGPTHPHSYYIHTCIHTACLSLSHGSVSASSAVHLPEQCIPQPGPGPGSGAASGTERAGPRLFPGRPVARPGSVRAVRPGGQPHDGRAEGAAISPGVVRVYVYVWRIRVLGSRRFSFPFSFHFSFPCRLFDAAAVAALGQGRHDPHTTRVHDVQLHGTHTYILTYTCANKCPPPCPVPPFRAAPGLRNDLRRPGHGLLAHPDLQAQGQAESAGLPARQGDRRSQPCRPGEVRSGQVRIPRSMCDVCVYGR